MSKRKGPLMLDVDGLDPVETPVQAAPVPEPDLPQGAAMQVATRFAARKTGWLSRLFWGAVVALLGMQLSMAAWDFVVNLLGRDIWLGRLALGLLAIVLAVLAVVLIRELAGFARMRRLDRLQIATRQARAGGQREAALHVIGSLSALYIGREDLRWARGELAERSDEILDADALVDLAERQLMLVLDTQARAEIEVAARQVAAATAIIPLALVDVFVALTSNVAMVRRIAAIYGGRAGILGSWRLLRAVATHLIATGAVAVGDDMIGSMVGGGAISKISRRFGEGVINGALTARVGVAAMEVCRPMPFQALKRPSVSAIVKSALTRLFG